jgi:hypothetical protein
VGILRLLSSSQDQRRVGGSILRLVLSDSYKTEPETRFLFNNPSPFFFYRHIILTFKITGVSNNGSEFLELFEDGHDLYMKNYLIIKWKKKRKEEMKTMLFLLYKL